MSGHDYLIIQVIGYKRGLGCNDKHGTMTCLSEPSGDVVFGLVLGGVGEDLLCFVELDQLPQVEERGHVGDSGGLLHVVGDDDHGVLLFQFVDQLLDLQGGDGVEGRAGLVHEDHFGLHGHGPGDAEALLLAAGQRHGAGPEAVLDLVPERHPLEADSTISSICALFHPAVQFVAGDDVILDGHGRERVGLLEDHADPAPDHHRVFLRS